MTEIETGGGRAGDQLTWTTAAKCLLNISYFDHAPDISAAVCETMLRTLTRLAFRTPRDGALIPSPCSSRGWSGRPPQDHQELQVAQCSPFPSPLIALHCTLQAKRKAPHHIL